MNDIRKLGTYSCKNKLYQAFQKLGRVISVLCQEGLPDWLKGLSHAEFFDCRSHTKKYMLFHTWFQPLSTRGYLGGKRQTIVATLVFSLLLPQWFAVSTRKKHDTSPFLQRSTNFLTARLCFRNETNGKPLWQWLSIKLNYSSTIRGKPLWQSRHTFVAKHNQNPLFAPLSWRSRITLDNSIGDEQKRGI